MSLAIFDLDNTLLGGDSDYQWGQFLIEKGVVDGPQYEAENKRYYEEYKAGGLDIYEFLRFALKPLAAHDMSTLESWRNEYVEKHVKPMVLPKALELVAKHRALGDTLMIITATNRFVTAPIAELFGIPHLLATDPEIKNGRYTGEVSGTPCFQEGKVVRLQEWLDANGMSMEGSWFYSDSHNDLPLLRRASHPVAVDADQYLAREAEEHGWPHISLR